MKKLSGVSSGKLRYDHIIGTGGIGTGIVFSLEGDHSLGRNESRLATLEPFHDYCKLHIIMHYVSLLLGADPAGPFRSYPIGAVGSDDAGTKLLTQMEQAGMDTGYVRVDGQSGTLYSVCYQYPDHSGGNITTANSASNHVSPGDIDGFFETIGTLPGEGIIVSVPEVPLETRIRLLQQGRQRGYLNAAAVLSSEAAEFKALGGPDVTDLLALNMDEARSMAALSDQATDADIVVTRCIEILSRSHPGITVLITDGARGSHCFHDGKLEHHPAIPAEAVSTAGAGDAFLAGTLTGICCGLPWLNGSAGDPTAPLSSAVDLGTLLASLSVTSPDTIHMGINACNLLEYAESKGLTLTDSCRRIFRECLQQSPSSINHPPA
jgi:sugar/nucleoside kinase (ribokinase family)